MALRSLVARMRTPAAAALRSPPAAPRLSPPAGARPRLYSSTQGEHGKRINLGSASEEEIRRQANLLRKEIDEATERVSLYTEKMPIIWKDIWGTVRLWVLAIASIELLLFSSSRLRTADEPDK